MTDRRHVTIEGQWAPIPEALLYDTAVSDTAVRVYGVLYRHGQDPANCYPSHARIGGLIGRSKRSVQAWVTELVDAGWVDVIARTTPAGDPDTNGYHVRLVPDLGRAAQRGVRADQRGGVRAEQRGGSALASAPKESHVKTVSGKEKPSAPPAAASGQGAFDGVDGPLPADPIATAARALVQRVWESRNPRPASPFMGLVKIATRLLEAGHSVEDVERAFMTAKAFTTAALEFQLNHANGNGRHAEDHPTTSSNPHLRGRWSLDTFHNA